MKGNTESESCLEAAGRCEEIWGIDPCVEREISRTVLHPAPAEPSGRRA